MARYPGWFGAMSMDAHRDARRRKAAPLSAVPNRGQSHILGLQYVIGYDFIAPRRSNSAHLRRPWRAIFASFAMPRANVAIAGFPWLRGSLSQRRAGFSRARPRPPVD